MNWMAFAWLILLLVFLAVESGTVTLVSIWFAAGALTAMIVSLCGAWVWLQVVLFFGVSVVALLLLRPLFKKYIKPKLVKTNVDSVLDMQGLVTEDIDNIIPTGQVKLGAMVWTARSTSGEKICAGTLVKADRVEGVKVFVSPVEVKAQVN